MAGAMEEADQAEKGRHWDHPIELLESSDSEDEVVLIDEAKFARVDQDQQEQPNHDGNNNNNKNTTTTEEAMRSALVEREKERVLGEEEEFSVIVLKRAPVLPNLPVMPTRRPIRLDRSSSPTGKEEVAVAASSAAGEDAGEGEEEGGRLPPPTEKRMEEASSTMNDRVREEGQSEIRTRSRPRPRPSCRSNAADSQRETAQVVVEEAASAADSILARYDDGDDGFFLSQRRFSQLPPEVPRTPSHSSSCKEEDVLPLAEGIGLTEVEVEVEMLRRPVLADQTVYIDEDEDDMLDGSSCSTSASCCPPETQDCDDNEESAGPSRQLDTDAGRMSPPMQTPHDDVPFYPDRFACLTNGADCDFALVEREALITGHFLCRAVYAGHSHGEMGPDEPPIWSDAFAAEADEEEYEAEDVSSNRDDDHPFAHRYFEVQETRGGDSDDEGDTSEADWRRSARFLVDYDKPTPVHNKPRASRSSSLNSHQQKRRRASSASSASTPLPTPTPPREYHVWTSHGQRCSAVHVHHPVAPNIPHFSSQAPNCDDCSDERSFLHPAEGIGTPQKELQTASFPSAAKMHLSFLLAKNAQ